MKKNNNIRVFFVDWCALAGITEHTPTINLFKCGFYRELSNAVFTANFN